MLKVAEINDATNCVVILWLNFANCSYAMFNTLMYAMIKEVWHNCKKKVLCIIRMTKTRVTHTQNLAYNIVMIFMILTNQRRYLNTCNNFICRSIHNKNVLLRVNTG